MRPTDRILFDAGVDLGNAAALPLVDSPYLTMREAVAYLRMERLKKPEEMIYRWVHAGRLKSAGRRGRAFLFYRQDLDAFVRGRNRRQS